MSDRDRMVTEPEAPKVARLIARERLLDTLRIHLGRIVGDMLDDDSITDIVANPDGRVWTDVRGRGWTPSDITLSADQIEGLIRVVASIDGTVCNSDSPSLETNLPLDGSRFTGTLPPASPRGPAFSIRKLSKVVIPLDDYVEKGILSQAGADALRAAVRAKLNILVSGGMGSGKTTFLNALFKEIADSPDAADQRVLIVEDTPELLCEVPNSFPLRTCASRTLRDCLRMALRHAGNRIIVGECRGAEAHEMLKSWNTGHPGGLCTLHANSAREALDRLADLVAESPDAPKDGARIARLISRAVQLVVHMTRTAGGRKVSEIARVMGFAQGAFALEPLIAEA